jgi:MFS family permease
VKRPLVALLAANAVSITGNVFTMLAVPWFVLETTGSAARTGVAAAVSTLPIVISAAFAGTLVDRVGLRRASVISDLASGLIVIAIPALYLTAGLSYGVLLALLFVRWSLATPGDTAREAMIPDLAERGQVAIERASAAYDGVYRGARMTGASVAGVLIAWLGPTALLFVDGATFVCSALLVGLGVPHLSHESEQPGPDGYLHRLSEGLAFLWRERLLRGAVAMILITNMLDTGLSQVLLPAYGRDVMHDPRAFGLLIGAVGAGALAGTVMYGAVGARLPRRTTFALAFLIAAAPRPLVLALHAPFAVALAITALAGFAAGAINPLLGVIQFERIPARLRARVLGTITAGAYAGMPLGGLLAGTLTELIGLTATLAAFSVVYLLASAPPFIGRSWKGLDAAAPRSDEVAEPRDAEIGQHPARLVDEPDPSQG